MATKTDKKNAIRQGIVDVAIVYSQIGIYIRFDRKHR